MLTHHNKTEKTYPPVLRALWKHLPGTLLLVGLTAVIAMITNASPLASIRGYFLIVIVCARFRGTLPAVLATGVAACLIAYRVPPSHSFTIDPQYRAPYAFFLIFGLLVSASHYVPRWQRSAPASLPQAQDTQAIMPTVADAQEVPVKDTVKLVSQDALYQAQRNCAHVQDMLWNVETEMQKGNSHLAQWMLQTAQEEARTLGERLAALEQARPQEEMVSHAVVRSSGPSPVASERTQPERNPALERAG